MAADESQLSVEGDPGPVGRLRLVYLDPKTLAAHPRNWRRHPQSQLDAMDRLIQEVGWADSLLFNEKTGRLVDGHGRRELAIARGLDAVPVLVGSWDEAEETKILASKDLMGGLAEFDPVAIESLLRDVETTSVELSEVLADAVLKLDPHVGAGPEPDQTPQNPAIKTEEDEPNEGKPEWVGVPDTVFPSDNHLGIPRLDAALQADAVDVPLTAWGSVARRELGTGTVHFYVDDRRFEPLWRDPGPIAKAGPPSVVEPNFSTSDQMPRAVAVWQTYRKRWLARYWQSFGIRVFVDLNVSSEHVELNLMGVPAGWRSYATRSHAVNGPEVFDAQFELARRHAGCWPVFLVIGGGKAAESLCAERGWLWGPDHLDTVNANGKR